MDFENGFALRVEQTLLLQLLDFVADSVVVEIDSFDCELLSRRQ
jgi:hypothetical protein